MRRERDNWRQRAQKCADEAWAANLQRGMDEYAKALVEERDAVAWQYKLPDDPRWHYCSRELYDDISEHDGKDNFGRECKLRALYTHPQDASAKDAADAARWRYIRNDGLIWRASFFVSDPSNTEVYSGEKADAVVDAAIAALPSPPKGDAS